jgi:catechol 2,3-dioxygenase
MDTRPPENRGSDAHSEIGHVHLRVGDLDRAIAFYRLLGFDTVQQFGNGVVFLGAGKSHPLIGLNTGAAYPHAAAHSPCRFAIRLPNRDALATAWQRLRAQGVVIADAIDHGIGEALYVQDPDGNTIELYYDRPASEWPRDGSGAVTVAAHPLDVDTLTATGARERETSDLSAQPDGMSESTRGRLRDMRVRLLNLHKALLEDAKAAYEMDRGRIGSNANLLQLVINDPWFAWLHPLSELVVRIDETLQVDVPATDADGTVLLDQVERLLSPAQSAETFARRYYDALQRQPAVIVAHAEVRRILKQAK